MASKVMQDFDAGVGLAMDAVEAMRIGSLQDLVEEVTRPGPSKSGAGLGGKMRVDTGFLRASLMISTAAMPPINSNARPPETATANSYQLPSYEAAIITSKMDETVYLGFTAAYAGPREFRDGFVETAVLNWPIIVSLNEEAARAAFSGRRG